MRTARIASLLASATLAFGLLVSAAPVAQADDGHRGGSHHRAGADTRDWPQGRSTSDPDGDSNGGWDKPGFRGGFDDDRDGNNGCGNDTDREDDNNGWCGRHQVRSQAEVRAANKFFAAKVAAFRARAAEVKVAWLAALESCRVQAGIGDETIDTVVEGVVLLKKIDCAEAEAVLAAAASGAAVTVEAKVETTASASADTAATAAAAATAASASAFTEMTAAAAIAPAPDTSVLGAAIFTPAGTTPASAATTSGGPSLLARTGVALALLALAGALSLKGGRLTALVSRRLGS